MENRTVVAPDQTTALTVTPVVIQAAVPAIITAEAMENRTVIAPDQTAALTATPVVMQAAVPQRQKKIKQINLRRNNFN
mgnify:CR=1 FL=1